jgi:CHAD domain-containing protein
MIGPTSPVSSVREGIAESLTKAPSELPGPVPGKQIRAMLELLLGDSTVESKVALLRESIAYLPVGEEVGASAISVERVALRGRSAGGALLEIVIRGVPDGKSDLAGRISEASGLEVSEEPSVVAAMELAGLRPPEHSEGEALRLQPEDRLVDSAYRVLQKHFGRMLWNEPGTRLGLDAEYLHDMRVASRRIRAALRLFNKALPPRRCRSFTADFKWVGRSLGAVRDLDVYLLYLEGELEKVCAPLAGAAAPYLAYLQQCREKARAAMLRMLSSKRYAALVERFGRWLEMGPPRQPSAPEATRPVAARARKLVRKRLRRVLKDGRALGRGSPDAELHSFRIRCKRLRYACEFFADLYGTTAETFAARVKSLQDILGAHQDAVVARERLAAYASGLDGSAGADRHQHEAMNRLAEINRKRASRTRARFVKAWRRFDRKHVRRPLKRKMKALAARQ